MHSLFRLACHIRDLDESRRFHAGMLGCHEGLGARAGSTSMASATSSRCTGA